MHSVARNYPPCRKHVIAGIAESHAVENKYEASFDKAWVKIYTRDARGLLELTRETRL
jgi:hypothetical protein